MAHSPFLFWDGRKDSLWAQALGPLESPVEHGGRREQYAEAIAAHFRPDYEVIFGPMPALSTLDEATAVFVNMGKAIAAYERTIVHAPSRFDRYVDALQDTGRAAHGVLSSDEVDGLRLFIAIPGAAELVGKGVYRGLPNAIPQPVRTGTQSSWARRLNARQPRRSSARRGGASP